MTILLSIILINLAMFSFIRGRIRKQPLWLILGLFLLTTSYYFLAAPSFTTKSIFIWLGLLSLISVIQIMLSGISHGKD